MSNLRTKILKTFFRIFVLSFGFPHRPLMWQLAPRKEVSGRKLGGADGSRRGCFVINGSVPFRAHPSFIAILAEEMGHATIGNDGLILQIAASCYM